MTTSVPAVAAAERAWDKAHPGILAPLQSRGVFPAQDFTAQFYARSTRSLLADVFWAVVEIFAPNCKAAKR